ncbi:DUF2530 domain-containing protein [Nocardia neocaledoniensis]|jgi:hypothetical protein|uniref:DUF2530 domain-containing protein n=1 Tax=Nocardia neocaledoniensis TaxID=236511 RepID=UPI002454A4B8|nr:DUF2530 domain-containing protein [Nocardia neocaledoniensis]
MDIGRVGTSIPELPRGLVDPRPVVVAGFVAWLVAAVLAWVNPAWSEARPVCVMGLVVGVLGVSIWLAQRRSARRGDKGAQVGLPTD